VGQRFLALLLGSASAPDSKDSTESDESATHTPAHPYFRVAALSASARSAGLTYSKACSWRLGGSMPLASREMVIRDTTVESFMSAGVRLVFSALDAEVAGPFETRLARAGIAVFSNAKSHRMGLRVPILVPHANAEHIDIVAAQARAEGYPNGGFIVTNANCSSTGLVVALRVSQHLHCIDRWKRRLCSASLKGTRSQQNWRSLSSFPQLLLSALCRSAH
jgi:aspartate-semialdehyde dehydrogenase